MNTNGYIAGNSLIHRMNPSLKFICCILFIVMIFIPFGFFFQIILSVVVISIYFIAKLPIKKLMNIFKSILVMMALLTLINWFSYKGPGVIFNFEDSVHLLFNPKFSNVVTINGKSFLQGYMWGGQYVTGMLPENIGLDTVINESNNMLSFNKGFAVINSSILIEGKSFNDVIRLLSKNYKVISYVDGSSLYLYLYTTKWYGFSSFAITLMLYVSIKVLLMIIVVTVLTSTTSSVELTYALEDILNPLRIFRLPITIWSTTIALGIRFIPSLLDESNRILKAQASRGLDFVNGNYIDKMQSLSSLIVPLFSIAFKKADELANAMEARGYDPNQTRTRYRDYKIHLGDWVFFAFMCMLLGFFIAMISFGKTVYITPLGLLDAIIMFGKN